MKTGNGSGATGKTTRWAAMIPTAPPRAELVFGAYLKSFFSQSAVQNRPIGAASARAGNVIGGGDWGKDRLVPDCIRALSSGQTIGIRSPHAVRPWQHVLEPLSGYLQLGAILSQDPQKYSGTWNFGPDESGHLTAAVMADRLIKYWGTGAWDDLSDPKAKKFYARSQKEDMYPFCVEQIRKYEEMTIAKRQTTHD
jgi:CDP-glucose 4,6-dehydratase